MATARTSASPDPSGADPSTTRVAGSAAQPGTIPVSEPQRELLVINDVVETFLRRLEQHGITVETSTLHTACISVTGGDPEVAKQCLASVVHAETVTFGDDDDEASSLLRDLPRKFPSRVAVQVGRGTAEVAVVHSIRTEVEHVLKDVKTPRKCIPLPSYLASFIQRHMQSFKAKFNSNFSRPIDLSIVSDSSDQPCLQLRCERKSLPDAQRVLEKMLALIWNTQMDVKRSLGLYLQNPDGKRHAHSIEESSRCTVSAETLDEYVLVSARSPQGHQVMICEGSLETTDCRVVLLPLCDGQTELAPSHKCILERYCLNIDPSSYLRRMGVPPKPQTLPLQCQLIGEGQTQTVIIMYIPPPTLRDFEQCVSQSTKDVLQSAYAASSGLAVPLKLSADIGVDISCPLLLDAIADKYADNHLPPVVKVYLDGSTECPDVTTFFCDKGWACEKRTTDEHCMDRVKVIIGDIFDTEADAIVNSTDPRLQHTNGQVSAMILEKAGPQLTQQCRALYPEGIGDTTVAITDTFSLQQFKHIFHIAMPQILWDKSRETELLETLRSSVQACLCLASVKGLSSIVFPAVASGTLRYPADKEARTVLSAARDFFSRMPHSTLTHVTFVCHSQNLPVVKLFKAEETICRFFVRHTPGFMQVAECRSNVNRRLIQVVKADPLAQLCSAELLVCAEQKPTGAARDNQQQVAGGRVQTVKTDRKMASSITGLLKTTDASSVQFNLHTFGTDHMDGVVRAVQKGLKSTSSVHIVIIFAPSTEIFKRVCGKLSKPMWPDVGTRESCDQEYTRITICGQRKAIHRAADEVKKVVVPDKYKQAEQYKLHPTFLDPPEPKETASAAPDQTPPGARGGEPPLQGEELVTVDLTAEELRELDMREVIAAVNALNMSICFNRGNVRIRTGLDNLPHATVLVRDMFTRLSQSSMSAIPRTVPDQVSGPGQVTRPATVQSGGGQSVVAEPREGFVCIPSMYLSGKKITQPLQQAARPPLQPDGASAASGFSMVSGPARAGDTNSKLSQAAPSGLRGSGLQQ